MRDPEYTFRVGSDGLLYTAMTTDRITHNCAPFDFPRARLRSQLNVDIVFVHKPSQLDMRNNRCFERLHRCLLCLLMRCVLEVNPSL